MLSCFVMTVLEDASMSHELYDASLDDDAMIDTSR